MPCVTEIQEKDDKEIVGLKVKLISTSEEKVRAEVEAPPTIPNIKHNNIIDTKKRSDLSISSLYTNLRISTSVFLHKKWWSIGDR